MSQEIPDTDTDADAVEVARGLIGSFDNMSERLSDVLKSNRRFRKVVIGLIISVILDLILSGGYVYTNVRSHNALVSQCQEANDTRTQDIAIWNTLIRYPASPAAAARNKADHLAQLVATKDKLKNCTVVYSYLP